MVHPCRPPQFPNKCTSNISYMEQGLKRLPFWYCHINGAPAIYLQLVSYTTCSGVWAVDTGASWIIGLVSVEVAAGALLISEAVVEGMSTGLVRVDEKRFSSGSPCEFSGNMDRKTARMLKAAISAKPESEVCNQGQTSS